MRVEVDGDTIRFPAARVAYRILGDTTPEEVVRSLNRELRLRRWLFTSAVAASIVFWVVSLALSSPAMLSAALLGIGVVLMRLLDPSIFGDLRRNPERVVEMDALRPRPGAIQPADYLHSDDHHTRRDAP